jgi:protein-disulfide isomerase
LIRNFGRIAGSLALAASALTLVAAAQEQAPAAPKEVPPAQTQAAPAAPAPTGEAPKFPAPDPKNFTATSPTTDQVNAFLTASWGYDENRVWQVQAITKTLVDGVSKVVVYIGDKTGKEKPSALLFWTMPDGKHIIAGEDMYPFGPQPYVEYRTKLQAAADGPWRGSADKTLEMVEFADFECPHCKVAQANMEKLATDFPKAHIVFQNYPLESIHPQAKVAAEYGVCVAKLGGNHGFFLFADDVFNAQEGLATADGAQLTLKSAVSKAGLDPDKVAACAAEPATAAEVEKSVTLARDLNINQTPMLLINGRQVPVAGLPYDTLKKIVEYQEKLDGIQQ